MTVARASRTRTPRPFRLTQPVASETEFHEAMAQALDIMLLPPAEWTTFPAGNVPLPPRFAAKLSRMGLKRGWPDILVVHDGRLHGLELKRAGGKLSRTRIVRTARGSLRQLDGQEDVFPRLERAGMRIGVAYTVGAGLALLEGWGVPMRGTAA